MFNLTNKKILITGASGGIGEAMAQSFHQAGATLLLHGTNTDKLQALVAKLGERASYLAADLSNPEMVDKLANDAIEQMGEIDVLVNNAALNRDGLFVRTSKEDWDLVMQVNLTACFQLSKILAYPMMRRKSGRIINITSVVAVMGNSGQSNYCAAKAGMIGLTKSMAKEIAARGVTINCIAPGFIKSPMTDKLSDGIKNAIMGKIPMARFGEGADIANCALYLASDEANYITGQTFHINGGMAMV